MPITLDDAFSRIRQPPGSPLVGENEWTDFNNVVPFPNGEEVHRALTQPTRAEGKDGVTRFEAAGKAIGHFVRMAREGRYNLEEAWAAVRQWNAASLVPPWSEDRLRGDFDRLVREDIAEKGPLVPVAPFAAPLPGDIDLYEWHAKRFTGPAPARQWLVEGLIPLGTAGVFAAVGDAGKSMLALKLAHAIGTLPLAPSAELDVSSPLFFGQRVRARGTAVVLTAEDDAAEVHRRLKGLDPAETYASPSSRLLVWPMLSSGGAKPVLANTPNGPAPTPFWYVLREKLLTVPDLAFVCIDPLSHFVAADTNDNTVCAALMAMMGELAAKSGAAVMLVHHFSKAGTPTSLRNARTAIRGGGALVDNGRWSIVLWEADEADAAETLKSLDRGHQARQAGVVYFGGLAKGNAPGAKVLRTLVRGPSGVLEDMTDELRRRAPNKNDVDLVLHAELMAIKEANPTFAFTASPTALWDSWGPLIRKNSLPITKEGKGRGKESIVAVFDRLGARGGLALTADKTPRWEPVPFPLEG